MRRRIVLAGAILLLLVLVLAASFAGESLAIYAGGIACVEESRTVLLVGGDGEKLRLDNMPSRLIPSSLQVDFDGEILAQAFYYTSPGRILAAQIGEPIQLESEGRLYYGTLLAVGEWLTLRDENERIHLIANPERIEIENRNELALSPYVELTVSGQRAGVEPIKLLYLTEGITWKASYIGILSQDEASLALDAWISVSNSCGRDFTDAIVKLVAGDVNREAQTVLYARSAMDLETTPKTSLTGETAFEYHVYRVPGKLSIANGRSKLFPYTASASVGVNKTYTYDGAYNDGVRVALEFVNSLANGLGNALPGGVARIFQQQSDGTTLFIGESRIMDTPADEQISLEVGGAFDLVGERIQVSREQVASSTYRESYLITLANHKEEAVLISVVEHPGGSSWEILSSSEGYQKVDSDTICFSVNVPAGEKKEVSYTVEYRY